MRLKRGFEAMMSRVFPIDRLTNQIVQQPGKAEGLLDKIIRQGSFHFTPVFSMDPFFQYESISYFYIPLSPPTRWAHILVSLL
jgi:hypothetical protein